MTFWLCLLRVWSELAGKTTQTKTLKNLNKPKQDRYFMAFHWYFIGIARVFHGVSMYFMGIFYYFSSPTTAPSKRRKPVFFLTNPRSHLAASLRLARLAPGDFLGLLWWLSRPSPSGLEKKAPDETILGPERPSGSSWVLRQQKGQWSCHWISICRDPFFLLRR